jgi:hypothetical protein
VNIRLRQLYRKERAPIFIEREAGWASELVSTIWRREKPLILAWNMFVENALISHRRLYLFKVGRICDG